MDHQQKNQKEINKDEDSNDWFEEWNSFRDLLGSYYEIADKGIYYLQLFGEIEDNLQLLENI
jgi:hypothetical protein